MGKRVLQSISPTGQEDRISLSPHDRGRVKDGSWLVLRRGCCNLSRATSCSIPGNASSHGFQLSIGIHNRRKLFGTKRLLIADPMVVEIRQIEANRFPIMADEVIGLRNRVKMLIPAFLLRGWL